MHRSAHFFRTKNVTAAPGRTGGPCARAIHISSIFEKKEISKLLNDFFRLAEIAEVRRVLMFA